jgi:hypothetical protein
LARRSSSSDAKPTEEEEEEQEEADGDERFDLGAGALDAVRLGVGLLLPRFG